MSSELYGISSWCDQHYSACDGRCYVVPLWLIFEKCSVSDRSTLKHKGLGAHAWWDFRLFFSCNLCNTFTVRHRTNRLVTRRHMVKTDVWLSSSIKWISPSALSSLHQFSGLRCDESDVKIRFVPDLAFFGRLTWLIVSTMWTEVEPVFLLSSYAGGKLHHWAPRA